MVEHPGEYEWSSYSANAQNGHYGLVARHPIYLELGGVDNDRQTAYRELFRHHLDNEKLHEIRESLNHELVLGRSSFKGKIEKATHRQARLGIPGRPMVGEEGAVFVVY